MIYLICREGKYNLWWHLVTIDPWAHIGGNFLPPWISTFPHLLFSKPFHDNKCGKTNGACIICRKRPSSHLYDKLDNSKRGSTQQWMTLTCCQDHILTENIWFVWSETSYSGDERRCYRCGTNKEPTNSKDRATQPMDAGGWVSQLKMKQICWENNWYVDLI